MVFQPYDLLTGLRRFPATSRQTLTTTAPTLKCRSPPWNLLSSYCRITWPRGKNNRRQKHSRATSTLDLLCAVSSGQSPHNIGSAFPGLALTSMPSFRVVPQKEMAKEQKLGKTQTLVISSWCLVVVGQVLPYPAGNLLRGGRELAEQSPRAWLVVETSLLSWNEHLLLTQNLSWICWSEYAVRYTVSMRQFQRVCRGCAEYGSMLTNRSETCLSDLWTTWTVSRGHNVAGKITPRNKLLVHGPSTCWWPQAHALEASGTQTSAFQTSLLWFDRIACMCQVIEGVVERKQLLHLLVEFNSA